MSIAIEYRQAKRSSAQFELMAYALCGFVGFLVVGTVSVGVMAWNANRGLAPTHTAAAPGGGASIGAAWNSYVSNAAARASEKSAGALDCEGGYRVSCWLNSLSGKRDGESAEEDVYNSCMKRHANGFKRPSTAGSWGGIQSTLDKDTQFPVTPDEIQKWCWDSSRNLVYRHLPSR